MFSRYQCSVCRRIRDIPKDNIRAIPNHCTITKGCAGYLFFIGNFPIEQSTLPVAGLEDWYPRGQVRNIVSVPEEQNDISLSNSKTTSLVIACFLSFQEFQSLGNFITIKFQQRRIENISQTQFLFHIFDENVSIVSGRDITGANLRFNQTHIDEHRIFVLVNGVTRFFGNDANEFTFSENAIIFNSPLSVGDRVTISILQQAQTIERQINCIKNEQFIGRDLTAWSNVRYLEDELANLNDDNRKRWWLFTATSAQLNTLIPGSRLKISHIGGNNNIENVRILLSKNPYEFTDRYLNLFVNTNELYLTFNLLVQTQNNNQILFTIPQLKQEIYPPMKLLTIASPSSSIVGSSFINLELEFERDVVSRIIEDTPQELLKITKVIGPVI